MRAKGFSLIELMIVIGVIAVINIVMVPNYIKLQQSAKQQSAKSSARNLMIAIEQYHFITKTYPSGDGISISELIPDLISYELIGAPPINPYTGNSYTPTDSSGQLLYYSNSDDSYQLVGYGPNNTAIIFEYP
jgi:general secretion pathway protein G